MLESFVGLDGLRQSQRARMPSPILKLCKLVLRSFGQTKPLRHGQRVVWARNESISRFLAIGFDDRLVSPMPRGGQMWPPFSYDCFD